MEKEEQVSRDTYSFPNKDCKFKFRQKFILLSLPSHVIQSAGAVEYTDCISAEG